MFIARRLPTIFAAALLATGLLVGTAATPARAVTISYQDYPGDECSGTTGAGFASCTDLRGSPVVAKYTRGADDDWMISSAFGDVVSSMFTVSYRGKGKTGSWTYDPGTCSACPVITSFVVKAGETFRWYYTDPKTGIFSGTWSTLRNKALSYISFYDTAPATPAPVPLPAAGLLLVGALGALGFAARRRKAAAA